MNDDEKMLVLKNFEFLCLTELGKAMFCDYERYFEPYRERHDHFCGSKCAERNCPHKSNPSMEAALKFLHLLNCIYWDKHDHLGDSLKEGERVLLKDFIPPLFSKYFTLPEAIAAIVHNWSGAPICGLRRFLQDKTDNYTFFELKKCLAPGCAAFTTRNHYKVCPSCGQSTCHYVYCYKCLRDNFCDSCTIKLDTPMPEGYVGDAHTRCKQCAAAE